MLQRRNRSRGLRRGRLTSMVAGASFVLGAVGWLAVNEQGRRMRVALRASMQHMTPPARQWLGRSWEWWMRGWRDPWRGVRAQVTAAATGDVLEVGVGTWPNVRRYRNQGRLIGVEDQRSSAFIARQRVQRYHPTARLVRASANALPFPDASFDTVVACLALCTVRDQAEALREIARVLRPGGTLRFLEHVRSSHPPLAWLQRGLTPFWRILADGCHMDRDTIRAIGDAGFTITELEPSRTGWWLTRPTYCGTAQPPLSPSPSTLHHTSEAL
ncbi:MAG: methyltransferase domain-containing protein [Ktedonobacterales bacterium]|nr:methyltransferase domain-containing protein [Ktedonobacterales bacterium]